MGEKERDVKIYHTLQKNKVWYGFIISDISDKCRDFIKLKDDLNSIVKDKFFPVEIYNNHYFIRGVFDSDTLEKIKDILKDFKYSEHKGHYSSLSSRYDFWEIIDSMKN